MNQAKGGPTQVIAFFIAFLLMLYVRYMGTEERNAVERLLNQTLGLIASIN